MKTGLAAAAAAAGLFPVRTYAAATVTFLGWQGYDDPLVFDGWTTSKEITLNTTYIGNNDEIVTKLRSGGLGTIDLVTPYMGYIPLMVKLGILQPVDRARVPNLEKVIPLFLNDSNLNPGGVHLGIGPNDVRPRCRSDTARILEGFAETRVHRQGCDDGRSARQHDAGGSGCHRCQVADATDLRAT
jgi:hypothetical protein